MLVALQTTEVSDYYEAQYQLVSFLICLMIKTQILELGTRALNIHILFHITWISTQVAFQLSLL